MSLVYNGLPNILPLHWNSQGQIDRVGDPQELLRLPVIALGIWLMNTSWPPWSAAESGLPLFSCWQAR